MSPGDVSFLGREKMSGFFLRMHRSWLEHRKGKHSMQRECYVQRPCGRRDQSEVKDEGGLV